MREGPLDTLDRARQIFLASIGDGIGKADAGADFYFAALSAKQSGYILKGSDQGLLNMFNSIIKEEIYNEEGTAEAPLFAQPLSPSGQESQYEAGLKHGGQAIPQTVWNPDRVVRPRVGQSLTGRQFEMGLGEAGHAYAEQDAIKQGPLYHRGHGDDDTAMVDAVSSFYLPDDAYAESRSQIDGKKELAWDKHHSTGDHDFVLSPRHYGKLPENMTNHHQYKGALGTQMMR